MKTPVRKYNQWLGELKSNTNRSRLQTALKVNNDMLILYRYIGKQVAYKIEGEGWGTKRVSRYAGLFNMDPEVHAKICSFIF